MKKIEFFLKIPDEDIFKILKEKVDKGEIKNFIFGDDIRNIVTDGFIFSDEYNACLYKTDSIKEDKIIDFVEGNHMIHSGITGLLFFLLQNDFVLYENEILLGTTKEGKVVSMMKRRDKYIFDLFKNIGKKEKIKKYYLMTLDIIVD